ncbi:MAG TPA: carboxylesterase family protein [Acidobacteriaceae bacterium]|nr:carboxylesterase family protein [Acidobacteriaceae bacterium]
MSFVVGSGEVADLRERVRAAVAGTKGEWKAYHQARNRKSTNRVPSSIPVAAGEPTKDTIGQMLSQASWCSYMRIGDQELDMWMFPSKALIGRVFFAVVLTASSAAIAQSPSASTDAGVLSGVHESGLSVYKGVPFAAPPVGDLRWQPPAAMTHWAGTRKADAFAPACMQTGVSMPGETPPVVSEDCLYLNVWTPAKSSKERLPVIVWIYGGAYTNGSASMPLYWGDRLAHKGVIVVTIAYRLGPLGFLAHPELTRESPHHTSGNYGLMDQIAALQWVQRNIASFGGDAKNVTIAGQSSGAISVSILMASPLARGLFQRAIGESGGLFEPLQIAPKYLLANAERDGEKYALSLGATSLQELRGLPAERFTGNPAGIVHPVIEPYVLPVSPYEAFAAGQQNDVPLLVGSNAEEARSLTDVRGVKAATFEKDVEQSFGQLPPALLAAYPHATDADAQQARLDLERDLRFGWDMWAWARLQAGTGKSPVYYYTFRQRPPFPAGSVYEGWGAGHFAELWYVFDHLDQEPWRWTKADRRVAAQVSGYWVNFAKSGNPNGPGLPLWPAFGNSDSKVMYLADPVRVGPVPGMSGLGVFDTVYTSVRKAPVSAP